MQSNDIKVSRTFADRNLEDDIQKRFNKDIFFGHLQDENLNFTMMLKDRTALHLREKFNLFLSRMKILYDIEISDMLIYLTEEKEYKIDRLYATLSSDNTNTVRKEMKLRWRFGKLKVKEASPINFIS